VPHRSSVNYDEQVAAPQDDFVAPSVRSRYSLPTCLPSWRIWLGISPSQRGLLLPSFRRFGHPPRRRV